MTYKLVKPTMELKQAYIDYIEEWENRGEKIVPYAARRNGEVYEQVLLRWEGDESDAAFEKGFVPSTILFMVDENIKIYGAVHIRHTLNDILLKHGGHIGYGVRASERGKGFATKILAQALPITKGYGIEKALVTCDKENTPSAKTIIGNGGVLEDEILQDGVVVQRYWIDLK